MSGAVYLGDFGTKENPGWSSQIAGDSAAPSRLQSLRCIAIGTLRLRRDEYITGIDGSAPFARQREHARRIHTGESLAPFFDISCFDAQLPDQHGAAPPQIVAVDPRA